MFGLKEKQERKVIEEVRKRDDRFNHQVTDGLKILHQHNIIMTILAAIFLWILIQAGVFSHPLR